MRDTLRVFAIVPAAGRSRRMGQPKQLMPIDGKPMLARVLNALAGLETIVVSNSDIPLDAPSVIINDDPSSEMIDSIRLGLRELDRRHPAQRNDGILICPADQPNLDRADVERCVAEFQQSPDRIIIAAHAGKRGHPMIFPRSLANEVNSEICDAGLNMLPKKCAQRVVEVQTGAAAIENVNTPQDLDAAQRSQSSQR